jgi:hypothetical protein
MALPIEHLGASSWKIAIECLMIADPNPSDGISLENPYGAMIARDAHGPVKGVIE